MEVKTIAIIGATELGCRVAYFAARAGYRTVLEHVSVPALEQGMASVTAMLRAEHAATAEPGSPRLDLGQLSTSTSVEDAAREADLLIEAVADDLEMKLELFTVFDKFAKPGAIFASTTNRFSITDLGDMTFCGERCIGMRFSVVDGGAEGLALVRGRATSDETVAACREVGRRMNLQVTETEDKETLAARGD